MHTYLDFNVFFKIYYPKGADINILRETERCSIKTFVNECFNLLFKHINIKMSSRTYLIFVTFSNIARKIFDKNCPPFLA